VILVWVRYFGILVLGVLGGRHLGNRRTVGGGDDDDSDLSHRTLWAGWYFG